MPLLQRVVKPKTQRGKRFLEKREPHIIENSKTSIFIRGAKTSETVLNCLKDLNALKKPHTVYFGRKNPLQPFEDISSLEFFSQRNDASLFMFGSHNKKRPHNIVIGRMYDHRLLDMFELGIDYYKGLKEFHVPKIALETKPCMVFAGEAFEQKHEYKRLKNLFIDFFQGQEVPAIRLAGLEHALLFTAVDEKIIIRSYRIVLKKSGVRTPRIELEIIGPSLDLSLRRSTLASSDLMKEACKQPRQAKPRKVKNIKKDAFGTKLGRIHMQRQDLKKLQTRKMKGLKNFQEKDRSRKRKAGNAAGNRKKMKTDASD